MPDQMAIEIPMGAEDAEWFLALLDEVNDSGDHMPQCFQNAREVIAKALGEME